MKRGGVMINTDQLTEKQKAEIHRLTTSKGKTYVQAMQIVCGKKRGRAK